MFEKWVCEKFARFMADDLELVDTTTEILVPKGAKCEALVIANEEGVVAGVEEVATFLKNLGLEVNVKKEDGEEVRKGDVVLEIFGDARTLLNVERTILDFLMFMSGIATTTRKTVEKARKANERVVVAATRKTHPGLRLFEKKAVAVGGGDTHRLSLADMVLIKDNHLKLVGSVGKAVKLARERASFSKKIEVEVSSLEEAIEAAESGADIVMLDNLAPEQIEAIVKELEKRGLRKKVLLEASGGIKLENIDRYAKTGVDIISLSQITMEAKPLDMKLEVVASTRPPASSA